MSFLETNGESHPTQFKVGYFSVLTRVVTCLLIFSSTPHSRAEVPEIDCLALALFQEQGLGMDLPHVLVQDVDR